MMRSLYGETLWSRRNSLLWYSIGMVLLVGMVVGVYPTVREGADTFTQLMEAMPQGLMSFFGSSEIADFLEPAGFINSRVNASIGAVVLAVYAISLGTGAVAGEEDRRTMDLILATPVTRHRIVLERFAAMVTLVTIVAGVVLVVMVVGNPIVDLGFSLPNMIASNLGLALLALVFGTVALAVGGLTGKRGVTVGIAAGLTVATFFINGLAELVDWLQGPQKLTPFYWLQQWDPLNDGFSIGTIALMAVVIAVLLGVAAWGFNRRDIAV